MKPNVGPTATHRAIPPTLNEGKNEQTKAISKLKAHQNEIQILKMEISKLKRQDNEVQKLRMKNLNLEKINRDLQFDIASDKILIKQLNDDLNQIKKTK